jgi:hypothetical protein
LLASGSVLLAPVILGNATGLSMSPLEPLFWMGCIYFLFLSINRQQPKLLLWCGVLLGFGLENKHSTVFFLSALVVDCLRLRSADCLPVSGSGSQPRSRLPSLSECCLGISHHFPTLEDLRNVKAIHKNVELPPLPFIGQQIRVLAPVSALV